MSETLIIGGGFAGLAAGVALSSAGKRVRILEQKPYLGGRARSFTHAATGATVDNGQHIFMGCYHETLAFLKTIGTLDRLRFQPQLAVHFADRQQGLTSLKCPSLPPPWHLLGGVLKSNSFDFAEKLQIVRLGRALKAANTTKLYEELRCLTVDEWMARMGQSEKLRRNFWDLLCIAALNEDPRIAAASVFEPVLRLALFKSARDSRIGLANCGLSECYTEAATTFIHARGGEVEINRDVSGLILDPVKNDANDKPELVCRGVRLSDGSTLASGFVLSAVPCFQLARLLPHDLLTGESFFAGLAAMRPVPIISLNLWLDRDITPLEFAGLRGTTVQWFFNKGKILGSGEHYISLVISGAHEHVHREKEELLSLALQELRELFPRAREAAVLHSLVIKERFATFSASVEAARLRPGSRTPVAGLYLAGDWTNTGLPATIESAVKSGYTAAREVLHSQRTNAV